MYLVLSDSATKLRQSAASLTSALESDNCTTIVDEAEAVLGMLSDLADDMDTAIETLRLGAGKINSQSEG
jgi:hypothetical protein